MTIETTHDAPESVIRPAEQIHDYLATQFGRDDVLVEVKATGAVQTTISPNAGVDEPGEWESPDDSPNH